MKARGRAPFADELRERYAPLHHLLEVVEPRLVDWDQVSRRWPELLPLVRVIQARAREAA